jgi:hypothetical protein
VHNEFDFRWIVNALRKVGQLPLCVLHYDMALYDMIYDVCTALYGTASQVLPGYVRTREQQVLLRHGIFFALQHERQRQEQLQQREGDAGPVVPPGGNMLPAANTHTRESSGRWVSSLLGAEAVLHGCYSAEDVRSMLACTLDSQAFFHDAPALAARARSCGLLMLPSAATTFARAVMLGTQAWELLQKQEYAKLQGQLRHTQLEDAPAVRVQNAAEAIAPAAPPLASESAVLACVPATAVVGPVGRACHLRPAAVSGAGGTSTTASAVDADTAAEQKRAQATARKRAERERKRQRSASPSTEQATTAANSVEQKQLHARELARIRQQNRRARVAAAAAAAGSSAVAAAGSASNGIA